MKNNVIDFENNNTTNIEKKLNKKNRTFKVDIIVFLLSLGVSFLIQLFGNIIIKLCPSTDGGSVPFGGINFDVLVGMPLVLLGMVLSFISVIAFIIYMIIYFIKYVKKK